MSFLDRLVAAVGIEHVLTEPSMMASYSTDWTQSWQSNPVAVVRPLNVEQVQLVLSIANNAGIAVTTQGGNTGLVGGSVGSNKHQHIIVSTKRIRNEIDFIANSNQIIVDSGITLAQVQATAVQNNLEYGVDIAARDSATIGGTVATNAGGIHVIANGMTAQHVCGLEIVLPDGKIQQDIRSDSANYVEGLRGEVVGSEGTLGVITKVCLQLQQPRLATWTALVPVDSINDAIATARSVGRNILAAEIMQNQHLSAIAQHAGLPDLEFKPPWVVLLQSDGDLIDLPDDSKVGLSATDQRLLWAYRERHTEFIARFNAVVKFDAKVPVSQLSAFLDEVVQITKLPDGSSEIAGLINIFIFGHLLDGNLHLAMTPVSDQQGLRDRLAGLVKSFGGDIRAEHGIGQAKSPYLGQSLTEKQLEHRNRLRDKFDPFRIMNPSIL